MNVDSLQQYEARSCCTDSGMIKNPVGGFVKVNDVKQLALPPILMRDEYRQLPLASYPEIDSYMERARTFVGMVAKGHQEVASLTATSVAEYMAFLDGKRLR